MKVSVTMEYLRNYYQIVVQICLTKDVCQLTEIKVNTTASHPQTDGLVEKFNRTLRAMIAKYSAVHGSS